MFPSDEFWKGAMFSAVIGGVIILVLKLWEKKGATAGNRSKKLPIEHDER